MGIAERREREKQQRRLNIVNAAEKVFFSRGYSGATMDEIAQEAELSKGTLYLYFKGKEEVHREIVSKGMEILFGLIGGNVKAASRGMSKLQVVWDTFMAFSREYADYCDALIHYETKEVDVSSPEDMERWLHRYRVIRFIIKIIREGMADRSIRQDMDPAKLTLLFWAQLTGAIQLIRFKRALIKNLLKIQPEEFLSYFREFVFEHLKPQ
jgi:AcrR family transcriptional regulator